MEGTFNNKNIKPTLNTPSKMGKNLDTQFKREIRKSGMNLKENGMMINEKEESLKKKIFKLDKMETLVHTDETLSKVFNDMKQDAAEKFGYHWNETILNIIFNDYVLNSPQNLQKYKNTRAKHKTRRGEEGIKELQNDIEKEREASSSAEDRKQDLMAGTANGDDKEKVDELFGFGQKKMDTQFPAAKRSKNDTYFVDTVKKRLLAHVPYAATPEEKSQIIQQFVGKPNIKQLAWYDAVKQGIQGVPTEVPDGSIQQIDQEMQKRYGSNLQTIPALAEDINNPETIEEYKLQVLYALKRIDAGNELMSHMTNLKPDTAGYNFLTMIQNNFENKITPAETAQRIRDSWFGVSETTGAASAGAFSAPLQVQKKSVTETTTSASSGQYSGKAIWAKNPKNSRFANKPAWKGGQIVSESVVKGNRDYLTESKIFKLYLLKNEIIDMLNESYEIGEAETFQQHSERMLAKLRQFAQENPELEKDNDFQELVKITTQRAAKPQQSTGTIPTEKTVAEHHLGSRQEKIDFIMQHGHDGTDLNTKSDEEIDSLYQATEQGAGINEAGDDKGEVYFEIEARLRPSDPALAFADIEDISNTYGVDTEEVIQIMHQVLSDREGRKSEDVESIVGDALKELEHSAIKPVSFEEVMNYLNSRNDMTGYSDDDLSAAYDRLTTDKAQLSLFENPDYKQALAQDIKNTSGGKIEDESTNALESKDGLFKGKWNENQNEGFGGDPEVGEDQYAEEQSANQYIALENQLKELTALKNAGKVQELKAKIDSMDIIPMAAHAGSPDELGHRDLEELGYVRADYEAIPMGDDDYDHELTIKNISNKPIAQLSGGRQQSINMLEPGQMMESKHIIVNDKNLDKVKDRLDEKAKSKSQQRFMGMVRAAQKGKLKDPSDKVAKAAESMSGKDAEDFASTKHKGLPEKKKKKINEAVGQFVEFFRDMQGEPPFTIGGRKYEYVWGKYPDGKVDIAVYDYAQDLVYDYSYFRQVNGIDEAVRNLNEAKEELMNINREQYKEFLKKKLTESAKTLKTLNEGQKKKLLGKIHEEFVSEFMIDDQPDSMINNQESSIAASMASDELNVDGQPVPNATSPAPPQQEAYDSDDIKAKKPMADKLADYSDDEPVGDEGGEETPSPVVAKTSVEKPESGYYHSGSEDTETIGDAQKFRDMLKAKYGADSVSELSPLQRQQLMKDMNFGVSAPEKSVDMDFSQFNTGAADKAAFQQRDQVRLDYLAKHANAINDINSYFNVAKQFKAETGENMHHPMAILASIEQLPADSVMRHKLSNIENALKSQMTKKIAESLNEERKTSSILNIEKMGVENAKNFKKDSAQADGLEQDKTYPHPRPEDSIQKAEVYPNPKDFYIDQDVDKVNREAKTMADIEKEALAKSNGTLNNIGNATADGKNIPKRNLSKEEQMELALNRGDGMQDIVYDNKPSEKFEERMKDDMGADIYKMREKKMDFRADAPMYNKDTQPTAGGDKKEENNKFKMGYNNESVTAKYRDEFGKLKLVEFAMSDVTEVTTINEEAIKLSVDGMGNKYNLIGKKINENEGFGEFTKKYDLYIVENKVVAIEKSKVIVETKIVVKGKVNESSLDKMKKLMNYNPNVYVDTKKSVKF